MGSKHQPNPVLVLASRVTWPSPQMSSASFHSCSRIVGGRGLGVVDGGGSRYRRELTKWSQFTKAQRGHLLSEGRTAGLKAGQAGLQPLWSKTGRAALSSDTLQAPTFSLGLSPDFSPMLLSPMTSFRLPPNNPHHLFFSTLGYLFPLPTPIIVFLPPTFCICLLSFLPCLLFRYNHSDQGSSEQQQGRPAGHGPLESCP